LRKWQPDAQSDTIRRNCGSFIHSCRQQWRILPFIIMGTMDGNGPRNSAGNGPSNSDSKGPRESLQRTVAVEGTNVIRVPFGIRQSRRPKPQRPDHWATLVLPFHGGGFDPTPPQAA